ncbi:MAG: hypothetical protein Q9195_006985 [Heterodermia aff. obscurata]
MASSPPVPETLHGKVAIVTGASRGIGAQIAFELAKRGAKVAIIYTSPSSEPSVEKLMERISNLESHREAHSIRADLRDPTAPALIVEQAIKSLGPHIDILVNNAGSSLARLAADVTASDFANVYDLNVRAVALMTAAVIPHLPPSGGRIINLGSVGCRSGFKEFSLYCSSKAAVEGLTRCYAAELGAKGHTANTVCPGPVPTDMLSGITKEIVENQQKNTPFENRLGSTDDIAQVVGFLAEEGSRWVTGQTISASGGYSMW